MTEPHDRDAVDAWAGWDETVLEPQETPVRDGLPDDAQQRAELIRQRLAHALLQTMHEPVHARERRVDRIMTAIRGEASPPGARLPTRKRALALSAAATLLVALAVWFWPPGMDRQRMEASLLAAVQGSFSGAVDREFTLTVEKRDSGGRVVESWRHLFVCDGDGRFYGELGGGEVGQYTVGSDGETVWRMHDGDPSDRASGPTARAAEILGDAIADSGLFAVGCLDVARLLSAMPQSAELSFAGEERLEPDGPLLRRFECGTLATLGQFDGEVRHLVVHIEPLRDVVERLRLELLADDHDGDFLLTFREQRARPVDHGLYRRPW